MTTIAGEVLVEVISSVLSWASATAGESVWVYAVLCCIAWASSSDVKYQGTS